MDRQKRDAFDAAWAKLAALPQNQAVCGIVQGATVNFTCRLFPWYGKNEAQCLEFIKK